jgi:hypothetical protein
MVSNGYRLVFDIAGGVRVASELSIEDVDEMRRSGRYLDLPPDDAEARRLVVRARLAYLTDMGEGHLVLVDPAGGEWIIPGRSVLSATFIEPGDEPEHRLGFGRPSDREVDVPWSGFTVLPGGKV